MDAGKELGRLAGCARRGGDAARWWDVWGDLVEVCGQLKPRLGEDRGQASPWVCWCAEQALLKVDSLQGLESLRWGDLAATIGALRRTLNPFSAHHARGVRPRVQLMYQGESELRALAARMGASYPELVRWLSGKSSPRLEARLDDWLRRGQLAFPDAIHPDLIRSARVASPRPSPSPKVAQDQLDLFGA